MGLGVTTVPNGDASPSACHLPALRRGDFPFVGALEAVIAASTPTLNRWDLLRRPLVARWVQPQIVRAASSAPSAIARSFVHTTDGTTMSIDAEVAKPQSEPAMTFSPPTRRA